MTDQALIQAIEALSGVASVRPFAAKPGRFYVNLASDGSNAARNTKCFVEGDKLTLDFGKGGYSDAFRDAVAELESFCAARGAVSRLYPTAASFTAVIR